MRTRLFCIVFALAIALPVVADDDAGDRGGAGPEVLERYFSAVDTQRDSLKGTSSEVLMTASIPKLKKQGKMNLFRKISQVGEITYKQINFWGDDTVKKEVIARYLTAETTAKQEKHSVAITPDNYNFKYKGLQSRADRRVHLFELKPKKKEVGLFKGELWVDPETYLPLREQGRFVKNPSIFLKKVEFVREYEIADGVARPKHIESVVHTRIAGKAELAIDYTNYQQTEDAAIDSARILP